MNWIVPLLLVVALALVLMARTSTPSLPPDQARRLLDSGGVLIDVRSPEEHRADRIPGAVNLPLDTVAESVAKRFPSKETSLLLHCFSGARSAAAARQLASLGYTRVYDLGGITQARTVVGDR